MAVVNSIADPALLKKAASAAGAVIGGCPWGCCWLPQGMLGPAQWLLADSASVNATHQGPDVALGLLQTWAV